MTRLKKILGISAVIPLLCLTLAGCIAPTLTVEITSPADGVTLTDSPITVNGAVSDHEALVKVNGEDAEVAVDGSFSAQVELSEGENVITAVAALGEQEVSDSITVTYAPAAPALSLQISSPEDGAELTESPVTLSGTVSDPSAMVTVNDEEIEVAEDGTFSSSIELAHGENAITVTATLEGYEPVTKTITVARVLAVGITSPEDEAELTESPITISGIVSDPEATVTVNGVEVEVAEDGSFSAQVELTEGENVIEAIAVLGEQEARHSITVTYSSA